MDEPNIDIVREEVTEEQSGGTIVGFGRELFF